MNMILILLLLTQNIYKHISSIDTQLFSVRMNLYTSIKPLTADPISRNMLRLSKSEQMWFLGIG